MHSPMSSLDHWWWRFLENHVYRIPPPPKRKRMKPMQVLCVGPPRSATESLQQALLALGYDHTYHGWDIVYDDPPIPATGWVKLARKKWYGGSGSSSPKRKGGKEIDDPSLEGDCQITAEEFDELLGHCVAVTDAAASCFAAEMIRAYPEAKVVLNVRRDLDSWHKSAVKTLVHVNESWSFWVSSLLDREAFWAWHVYERFLWALFFRAPDGDMARAIRRNGKWVYRGEYFSSSRLDYCLSVGSILLLGKQDFFVFLFVTFKPFPFLLSSTSLLCTRVTGVLSGLEWMLVV